ncbi:hypothetical protein [Algirhabdus cladophorae]|uniref:hypothetical protein n=1 Tax=Algirhabdus cladophorae TaxID=3377108 RepID=UPI003B845900
MKRTLPMLASALLLSSALSASAGAPIVQFPILTFPEGPTTTISCNTQTTVIAEDCVSE